MICVCEASGKQSRKSALASWSTAARQHTGQAWSGTQEDSIVHLSNTGGQHRPSVQHRRTALSICPSPRSSTAHCSMTNNSLAETELTGTYLNGIVANGYLVTMEIHGGLLRVGSPRRRFMISAQRHQLIGGPSLSGWVRRQNLIGQDSRYRRCDL